MCSMHAAVTELGLIKACANIFMDRNYCLKSLSIKRYTNLFTGKNLQYIFTCQNFLFTLDQKSFLPMKIFALWCVTSM